MKPDIRVFVSNVQVSKNGMNTLRQYQGMQENYTASKTQTVGDKLGL